VKRKANQIVIWGVVLLIVGAGLTLFVPNILLAISAQRGSSSFGSETVEILLRMIETILPPLGAALTAAGVALRVVAGGVDWPRRSHGGPSDQIPRR
jgi:Na+/proline symporter